MGLVKNWGWRKPFWGKSRVDSHGRDCKTHELLSTEHQLVKQKRKGPTARNKAKSPSNYQNIKVFISKLTVKNKPKQNRREEKQKSPFPSSSQSWGLNQGLPHARKVLYH